MQVRFKYDVKSFNFNENDYVTIVIRYFSVNDETEYLWYHGTLTQIENIGFWCVLDDDKTKEEYFSFIDVENVIHGSLIPFLGGYTKRKDIIEKEPEMRSFDDIVKHLTDIETDSMPTLLADILFHDKLTDVLSHCLSNINDSNYKEYVKEQLTNKELTTYGFEKIQEAVKNNVEKTFKLLTEEEIKQFTLAVTLDTIIPGMKVKIVSADLRPNETNVKNGEVYEVAEISKKDWKDPWRYITTDGKSILAEIINLVIDIDEQRQPIIDEWNYWHNQRNYNKYDELIVSGALDALEQLLYNLEVRKIKDSLCQTSEQKNKRNLDEGSVGYFLTDDQYEKLVKTTTEIHKISNQHKNNY